MEVLGMSINRYGTLLTIILIILIVAIIAGLGILGYNLIKPKTDKNKSQEAIAEFDREFDFSHFRGTPSGSRRRITNTTPHRKAISVRCCGECNLVDLSDDGNGGLLGSLSKGVILEDSGQSLIFHLLVGLAEDVDADVVGIDDDDLVAVHSLGQLLGNLVGLGGSHFGVGIVGGECVVAGTVNGANLFAQKIVEHAADAEKFADTGNDGAQDDLDLTDLADGKFHGPRAAQTDAVGGLIDKLDQEIGKFGGLDLADGEGTTLTDGNDLFAHEDHVVALKIGFYALVEDLHKVISVHDDLGLDGITLKFAFGSLYNKIFAFVGNKLFDVHFYASFSQKMMIVHIPIHFSI